MPKFNFKFSILGVKIKNRLPVSPRNQSHICKCFSMSLRGPEELVERTKVEGGGGGETSILTFIQGLICFLPLLPFSVVEPVQP